MTDPLRRLEPARTTLVVVDPQTRLLAAIPGAQGVVRAVRLLLRAAAVLRLPVVATTQYARGLGGLNGEIEELLPESSRRLDKTAFSCFDDVRFAGLLDRRELLVCGVETHICVAGTVLGGLRAGLAVTLAADAVAARGEVDHTVACERMRTAGAALVTAEAAVYELLGDSSCEGFRALLPYLKNGP